MNVSVDKNDIQAIAREALPIAQAVSSSMARAVELIIERGVVYVENVLDEQEAMIEKGNSWKLYSDYPPFFWYLVELMKRLYIKHWDEENFRSATNKKNDKPDKE